MNYPIFTIKLNRLGYKSKSNYHSVYLQIYFKGKTDYVRLKELPKLLESEWIGDSKSGVYVRHQMINEKINEVLTEVRNWSIDQVFKGHHITIKTIKDHYWNPKATENFNAWCHHYVRNINKGKASEDKLAYRTIQAYQSFLVKLDEFDPKIEFEDITQELVEKFNQFLGSNYNLNGTTRQKHFEKFKVCYNAAGVEGVAQINIHVFGRLKIKRAKTKRVALTLEELRQIRNTKLNDKMDDKYKSIFLFSCLCGLYYNDVKNLKVSNLEYLQIDKQSLLTITATRYKNDEEYSVPLNEDAIAILEKYSNWSSKSSGTNHGTDQSKPMGTDTGTSVSKSEHGATIPGEKLLFSDLISDVKYNLRLKQIARQLGITKNLTGKVARFSYAELHASFNISNEKLARTMGHTSTKTTAHYSRMSRVNALRGWNPIKL